MDKCCGTCKFWDKEEHSCAKISSDDECDGDVNPTPEDPAIVGYYVSDDSGLSIEFRTHESFCCRLWCEDDHADYYREENNED